MRIDFLTVDDAEAVAALAAAHYPASYPMSVDDIRENLESADFMTFYLGVREGRDLLGYYMAWVENTLVEGRTERVALIDDIVLIPRARVQYYNLIATMIATMKERGMGLMPIEGTTRPDSTRTIVDHPGAIARLGYRLTTISEYFEPSFGEMLTWVRFDAIVDETGINAHDVVDLGSGDDVYWQ